MRNKRSEESRGVWWKAASKMPPLSNYPDKSQPFDVYKSEVIRWLADQPEILNNLFDHAASTKAIVYDKNTDKWVGVNYEV